MSTCLLCKKDVTSGYVVCGDCAEKVRPESMQLILNGFTSWLSADLVGSGTVYFCSECRSRKCDDDAACRQGVFAWYQKKVKEFLNTGFHIGLLGQLKTVCPFPKVFEDLEPSGSLRGGDPRRKIGHIRADYDGHRWWNTIWSSHWDLATAEMKAEMDRTYEALTASGALCDLNTLRRFCWSHPEAQHSPEADDEFNFYLVGETCDFWVRLVTREKDYNMYLNAYAKGAAE